MLATWGRQFLKARLSKNLRRALRDVGEELYVQRMHRTSAKDVSHLAGRRGLRLDLREPLPFEDESAAAIDTEHFFEHLSYPNLGDSTAWQLDVNTAASWSTCLSPGRRIRLQSTAREATLAAATQRRAGRRQVRETACTILI